MRWVGSKPEPGIHGVAFLIDAFAVDGNETEAEAASGSGELGA